MKLPVLYLVGGKLGATIDQLKGLEDIVALKKISAGYIFQVWL